jgi:hypothetical protein
MRQYERKDVDYGTWYSSWMKRLARTKTRAQIEVELGAASSKASSAADAHLRAIESTTSMTSNSARRAHARNSCAAAGDYKIALGGALEIHDLFPEYATQHNQTEGEER